MSWRLPSVVALRAFEVAGRHLSFTQAAAELHVTAGAISRQVKLLEEALGIPLFDRAHREVRFTPAGKTYFAAMTEAFARMDAATTRVRGRSDMTLEVGCSVAFARNWLAPRLMSFHTANPGSVMKLTTSLKPFELDLNTVNVAIRLGNGTWPHAVSTRLMSVNLVPICSPDCLKSGKPLRTVADLANYTLLHSKARPDIWGKWLAAAGAHKIDPRAGLRYDSSSITYQAAIEGKGIALGQHVLISEDLAVGRLVMPFNLVVAEEDAYYLVYPERLQNEAELVKFRDWIVGEARLEEEARRKARFSGNLSVVGPAA